MTSHSPGRRTASVVLAVATATALSACTSEEGTPTATETTATPTPAATPTATPTPELEPVTGTRHTSVVLASGKQYLGLGADPEPRMGLIENTFTEIGDWLDAHLDALQRTGNGRLGDVIADGIGGEDARTPVTTHLASPDRPVTGARYAMKAYHTGKPQLVSVRVAVTHPDSDRTVAELGFAVADDGTPILVTYAPVPAGGDS